MKLATERDGSRDGRLLVVSRDQSTVVAAAGIAGTLQEALDRWDAVREALERLYDDLNAGRASNSKPFDASSLAAPLPRAWQWLDGSAYPTHGKLMQRAYNLPELPTDPPLMYQGMSHEFQSATDDAIFPDEAHGIDFEGELGAITGDVPMGASPAKALQSIRLLVQINDWSLRVLGAAEMRTGFGWVTAKPACSMAPVAVTPEELGTAWSDGRLDARLLVALNGERFGDVPTVQMEFGFHDLIAHAAKTRSLCAGTIIGSGTASSPDYADVGSCCLAERRAIETIENGTAVSRFMRSGDRVSMTAKVGAEAPFGPIDQLVVVRS